MQQRFLVQLAIRDDLCGSTHLNKTVRRQKVFKVIRYSQLNKRHIAGKQSYGGEKRVCTDEIQGIRLCEKHTLAKIDAGCGG